jgi:hypothetical protein
LIGNKTLLRSEKTPKCIKYALKGGKDYKEKGEQCKNKLCSIERNNKIRKR